MRREPPEFREHGGVASRDAGRLRIVLLEGVEDPRPRKMVAEEALAVPIALDQ